MIRPPAIRPREVPHSHYCKCGGSYECGGGPCIAPLRVSICPECQGDFRAMWRETETEDRKRQARKGDA